MSGELDAGKPQTTYNLLAPMWRWKTGDGLDIRSISEVSRRTIGRHLEKAVTHVEYAKC